VTRRERRAPRVTNQIRMVWSAEHPLRRSGKSIETFWNFGPSVLRPFERQHRAPAPTLNSLFQTAFVPVIAPPSVLLCSFVASLILRSPPLCYSGRSSSGRSSSGPLVLRSSGPALLLLLLRSPPLCYSGRYSGPPVIRSPLFLLLLLRSLLRSSGPALLL